MARHTLQFKRNINQALDARIVLIPGFQLGAQRQRLFQRHAQIHGHLLGDLIGLGIGIAQHAAHIADHAARGHGAKGNDLAHMILPVLVRHIVDHFLTALIAEVHVDIGHADALGIEEALKRQVIPDGIQLGDIQAIGHDAGRAAAASGAHHDARVLGELDEIPHDQKVIHIPHLGDHADFVFQALARHGIVCRIALGKALLHQLAQQGIAGFALGHREVRQMDGIKIKRHVAAHGDIVRALHRVRMAGEQRQHFIFAFHIQLIGIHAHAVLVIQRFARLDAHEHLLRFGVLAAHIVAVVGDHQGNAGALTHIDDARQQALFLRDAMIHDFDIKMIGAKQRSHLAGILFSLGDAAVQQELWQIARQARRQADQPLAVLAQQFIIDTRLIVKTARKGLAAQIHQVLVARIVLAQQNQVAIFAVGVHLFIHIGAQVHFAPDHRMHARILAGGVKIHHAIEHAMVGDGAGVHAQLLNQRGQLFDAARAVQQAVLGMQMQMRKRHGDTSPFFIFRIIPQFSWLGKCISSQMSAPRSMRRE